jgi:hypothetical protein
MRLFKPKATRAKPVDREGLEQAALIKELELRLPAVAELIYHVPNGGHRHKLVAIRLNDQGYLAIVCRGHFDAIEQIRAYLRLPRTVVAA